MNFTDSIACLTVVWVLNECGLLMAMDVLCLYGMESYGSLASLSLGVSNRYLVPLGRKKDRVESDTSTSYSNFYSILYAVVDVRLSRRSSRDFKKTGGDASKKTEQESKKTKQSNYCAATRTGTASAFGPGTVRRGV